MTSTRQALLCLRALAAEIEKGQVGVIKVTSKRKSEKADFGGVCYETHLGDTVIFSIKVVEFAADREAAKAAVKKEKKV